MYKSDTQEYYRIVTCNICYVVLWWKCKYSYTYDAIGNPTTYRGASLAFNGRQLTSYNDGTNAISYTYDASGLRASKTVNGETTIYQYVGDKLYYEQRADGSKHYYFYDSYGNLAKIYRHTSLGQKVYNVVTNAQGDVIALYDYAGVLVCTYEYDAWGNLTFARDSAGNIITSQNHIAFLNPIRYRGYYYDSEIGMYYLQSRYYDPDTGRFINADGYITTGQGVLSYNMFAYCMNNPVMLSDPSGEIAELIERIIEFVETTILFVQLKNMGFDDITFTSARECLSVLKEYNISSPTERAHFFSQCAVETNYGMWLTEIGGESYFKDKPYGYKYRGAGYIQLTWDYNYKEFSIAMNDPEIYNQGADYVAANYAWHAAGWFWSNNKINNKIANGATSRDITRIVKGSYSGYEDREACYNMMLDLLS